MKSLNLLQFIEADENIFFNNWQKRDELARLAKYSLRFRKADKEIVDKLYEVGHEDTSQLIYGYHNIPDLHMDLSFLQIRRSVQKTPLKERINQYRHELPKEYLDQMEFAPPPNRPMQFKRLGKEK